MAEIPYASLKALASELNALEIDYAFRGGSIVGLLLDNPDLTPMRPKLSSAEAVANYSRRLERGQQTQEAV